MKTLYFLFLLLFLTIIGAVYHSWFFNAQIIGGDWPYFFESKIQETSMIPPSWHSIYGNGLGGMSPFYSLQTYHNFTVSLASLFHLPWEIVYKIFWFGMFLGLAIFSSFYLLSIVDRKSSLFFKLTGTLIYTTNTYILMVVSGGQMGVGLAYAVCPLILGSFIQLIDIVGTKKARVVYSLQAGLFLSLAVLFDPRVAFLAMVGVFLYSLFSLQKKLQLILSMSLFVYILPLLVVIVLHTSWLLPLILYQTNPANELGTTYTSVKSFIFFSFGNFSHSFSLLQPNWPENVFGKIGFLDPKFLLMPILAYVSLLFITPKNSKYIFFFCLLGLLGAFLGKGANEPFGQINIWLFENIQFFTMFRDPTKFYICIALAYSVLIPYTLYEISKKLHARKYRNVVTFLPFFLFFIFWVVLIFPAVSGKISGTFATEKVPIDYLKLEKFLRKDESYFRTLWVPRQHRFSFVSDTHPAVEAQPLFKATNAAEIVTILQNEKYKTILANQNIRYVMVPYDPKGEIFNKDRKYDSLQYEKTLQSLRQISWLTEVNEFGRIGVFKTENMNTHFWISHGTVVSKMNAPDDYTIKIVTKKPATLVFSEAYNPYWFAELNGRYIDSKKTPDGLNSFFIEKPGTYTGKIVFVQKLIFTVGWYLSVNALFIIVVIIFIKKRSLRK